MTDKPVSVINEPKNLLELVVCPSDRQYDLDISSIAPQCKTLSKKQLINYI